MENKEKEAWWQEAVVMFAKVSAWVAIPIVAALFVGKYFDKKYDTSPWIFIGATIIAFIISMIALGKISLDYIHKIDKESKDKKNGESN
jgi:F0F1-type ATP synthase assembly protein I